MNKNIIIGSIVGIVVLAGGALMINRIHAQNVQKTMTAEEVASSTTPVVHYVGLLNDHADPSDLLIKVGEYIEFDSKDGKSHNIASGKHATTTSAMKDDMSMMAMGVDQQISSGVFAPDEGYKVQFKKIGTYNFYDSLNPTIVIRVAVYDPTQK